ncbi:MAG: hypothetical protein AABY05_03150 [Nanoarchaeota archaeon]
MRINIAKRHWFIDNATALELKGSLEDMRIAAELKEKYRLSLSLIVSTDEKIVDSESLEIAENAVRKIKDLKIPVLFDKSGPTAGQRFASHLFSEKESSGEDTVLGLCCLDQYPLGSEDYLRAVVDLGHKLLRDNKWYANGARNISVNLGINKKPSDMRIIHELLHVFLLPEGVFKAEKPSWANPSEAYDRFGETTSGFYLINATHASHGQYAKEIRKYPNLISSPGFAIEYFTAIFAGLRDLVSTGYVYAKDNKFYSKIDIEKELSKVEKFIVHHSRLLGSTRLCDVLRQTASDENKLKRLDDLFEPETVRNVARLVLEGLSS